MPSLSLEIRLTDDELKTLDAYKHYLRQQLEIPTLTRNEAVDYIIVDRLARVAFEEITNEN